MTNLARNMFPIAKEMAPIANKVNFVRKDTGSFAKKMANLPKNMVPIAKELKFLRKKMGYIARKLKFFARKESLIQTRANAWFHLGTGWTYRPCEDKRGRRNQLPDDLSNPYPADQLSQELK